MSNLHQIGTAIAMYALDNKDHYPDALYTCGNWSYRRQPGLRDPLDPSSRPEWLGLAAVLHGIKSTDYTTGMTTATINATLLPTLGKNGLYLSAVSKTWVCPAFPEMFVNYGNTYCYNNNNSVNSIYNLGYDTSIGRAKLFAASPMTLVAWENSNFLPYTCGTVVPSNASVTGYTLSKSIYPHPGKNGKLAARNELYLDSHVDQNSP